MLDTNVKGCFHLIKLVVPGMISRNRGHVINISRSPSACPASLLCLLTCRSIAGLESYRNGSMYCASKCALPSSRP